MPVQNPGEALLSFEVHLLDEPVQSLGLGLRDRKGRREDAVSMANVHLTHVARTQHRICLLLQQDPQPQGHSSASLPPLINPDWPQQRFLREQPHNSQHLGGSTLRQSPNPRSAGAQALREEGTCFCPSCCQDASSGRLIRGCACFGESCQQNCFIKGARERSFPQPWGSTPTTHLEFGGTNKSITPAR